MSAMSIPGLDTYLTTSDEPRRKYRTREEAVDAIAAEIRADRDRMLGLLEEDDSQREDSELADELRELVLLLAAPENDTRAARELAIKRRDIRSRCRDLVQAEAGQIVDGEI